MRLKVGMKSTDSSPPTSHLILDSRQIAPVSHQKPSRQTRSNSEKPAGELKKPTRLGRLQRYGRTAINPFEGLNRAFPSYPSDFRSNLAECPTDTSLCFCPQLSRFSIPMVQLQQGAAHSDNSAMYPKQLPRRIPWRLWSAYASNEAGGLRMPLSACWSRRPPSGPSASRDEEPPGYKGAEFHTIGEG
jgi:hypothetical protein